MQVADENGLEFLDLKLKTVEGKINIDVYSKPTSNFTYVLPSTCCSYKYIRNVPKGIALRLRRICDGKMTKTQVRTSKEKPNQVRKINIFTSYNISLPCMNTLIKKHFPLLRSDDNLKDFIS